MLPDRRFEAVRRGIVALHRPLESRRALAPRVADVLGQGPFRGENVVRTAESVRWFPTVAIRQDSAMGATTSEKALSSESAPDGERSFHLKTMVEAVGIEPTSDGQSSQDTTSVACVLSSPSASPQAGLSPG